MIYQSKLYCQEPLRKHHTDTVPCEAIMSHKAIIKSRITAFSFQLCPMINSASLTQQRGFFPAKFLSNGNVAPRGNVTSLNIGHEGRRKIVSCLGNRSSQIFVIYFRDFSQPFIDRFHNKGPRSSQIGK